MSRGLKERDKSKHREKDKSRGKSNKFANIECYQSDKKGHIKKYCQQLNRENRKDKSTVKHKDESSDDNDHIGITSDCFLIIHVREVVKATSHDMSWVIDSGVTTHATSQRDCFISYIPIEYGILKMGDNTLLMLQTLVTFTWKLTMALSWFLSI